jgi:pimeloyl-ACP methyl ester carboxylesterase
MKLIQKIALTYISFRFRILSLFSKKIAARKAFELFCTPQFRNKKKLPPVFNTAERLTFRFQQYNVVGHRWNKGGRKRVLILHGFESATGNFETYITAFIQKGYETLAFDAPAHGLSSGKQINILIYKEMILAVQEKYGPIQSFMAHSFGGMALSLALAEMKYSDGTRVALIAPLTETSTSIDLFFKTIGLKNIMVKEEFEKIILQMGGHPSSWFSLARLAPAIKAEILWIHDEDDKVTPWSDAAKVKEKNYPHIRFICTRELGHRRIYRDPDVIMAVVDFL